MTFVNLNEIFVPQTAGGGGEAVLNSMKDYVISHSATKDSNGDYIVSRKWNSGLWEYIMHYASVSADCTTVYGNSYYCDKKDCDFPKMVAVYYISMFHTKGTGGSWFNINSYNTTTGKYDFRIFNPVSNTRTISVAVHVIGSWK